jgi:hypothetical protein
VVELVGAAQMAELKYALRSVSDEVADVVLSELEDIAKGVAADARKRVPYRSGRAQQSYKAQGSAIVFGDGVPYVPWLEFGGAVGRKGSVKRPYVREGRYVYPAINAAMADIEARVGDLIAQMTAGYLEVE